MNEKEEEEEERYLQVKLDVEEGPELEIEDGCCWMLLTRLLVKPIRDAFGMPGY